MNNVVYFKLLIINFDNICIEYKQLQLHMLQTTEVEKFVI
jgi:hypothetical protein